MTKIVILEKENLNLRFLAIRLEGKFNVQVEIVHSEVQAIKSLSLDSKKSFLIIKGQELNKLNLLSNFLKDDINVTTIYESMTLDHLLDYDCHYIHDLNNYEELFDFLSLKGLEECQFYRTAYTKITLYNFMVFTKAVCDYYISLGADQFLKIVQGGDLITNEMIKDFEKKKTQYVFIKSSDLSLFNQQMNSSLLQIYMHDKHLGKTRNEVHLASIENIKLSLKSLGLTEQTLTLANTTVENIISDFKGNVDVWSAIEAKSDTEYFSEKTMTVSFLCYAMVENLEWNQPKINEKLIMSSLLHDIALSNPELSLVLTQDDVAYKWLSKNEKQDFLEHPAKAVKLINKSQSLPIDVEKIISEHHERPDGTGFPKGLTSSTISPLSCIFILAEEFCQKLYSGPKDKKTVNFILGNLEENFSSGNFKSPYKALTRLFK